MIIELWISVIGIVVMGMFTWWAERCSIDVV